MIQLCSTTLALKIKITEFCVQVRRTGPELTRIAILVRMDVLEFVRKTALQSLFVITE